MIDKTEKCGITLPISLVKQIDKARGDVPRSTFIRRALEQYTSASEFGLLSGDYTIDDIAVVILLTRVFLSASVISISAYPQGPIRYPIAPVRGAVLEAPIASQRAQTVARLSKS